MCELLAMSARFSTNLSTSLNEFARHGGETGPHTDGWGLTAYDDERVVTRRELIAASDSSLLKCLGQHELRAQVVIAHIRKATQGDTTVANSHPFVLNEGTGTHSFAHNGDLDGFAQAEGLCLGGAKPVGTTDSEYVFRCLMNALRETPHEENRSTFEQRWQTISQFAAVLRRLGPANFLYADGQTLFVHAHIRTQPNGELTAPGLHLLRRDCKNGDGQPQRVTLIASVPMSDEPWRAMQSGELLAIQNGDVIRSSHAATEGPKGLHGTY